MGSTFSKRNSYTSVEKIPSFIKHKNSLDIERMSLEKHLKKTSEERNKQWKTLKPEDIPISNVFFGIEYEDSHNISQS